MTRGILFAGNESALFAALAGEALKRTEKYAAAVIRNPAAVNAEAVAVKGRIPLDWNPGSPISNRTLILSAENWLGQINDAILVCSPPAVYRPAEALVPAEIDTLVNAQIKGWFFLVRELAIYFRAKSNGILSFVIPETGAGSGESASDLFGAPASALFRAFAGEMLLSASVEPFRIMGFSYPEAGQENEFAPWLFKILDEGSKKNSGKWHKFGKLTPFRMKSLLRSSY